jgi:hypothetical protein
MFEVPTLGEAHGGAAMPPLQSGFQAKPGPGHPGSSRVDGDDG